MVDTNWTSGEGYDTRDSVESLVNADQNRTEAVRNLNRQRIDSAFPTQGTEQHSAQGSQSAAPDSQTTPAQRVKETFDRNYQFPSSQLANSGMNDLNSYNKLKSGMDRYKQ